MRQAVLALAVLLWFRPPVMGQSLAPEDNEALTYTVNWPSGLSLGEAQFQSKKIASPAGAPERWDLRFSLDAAIPGFTVADRFRSVATSELCSTEFERDTAHGQKSGKELTLFDLSAGRATRQTLVPQGGGKSQLSIPACPKDALAFLYYVRRELAQGRLPPPQTVFFGGPYQVRLEYAGSEKLRVGDEQVEADRITASVKGAASDVTFDIFFAQDQLRRPVLVRVPLPLGAFTMELAP